MADSAVRWCARGDTIATVRPVSRGQHIHVTCPTPESCAEANDLIAAGRWQVVRCGRCDTPVEACRCESKPLK